MHNRGWETTLIQICGMPTFIFKALFLAMPFSHISIANLHYNDRVQELQGG